MKVINFAMAQSLVIGTRGSKLALVQATQIEALLRQQHPDLTVERRIISTKGDRILDVALSDVGDKGLFVKELEAALLAGEVDLAVHSGKDLPSFVPEGLTLAAFPKRVDPRDVLVLPKGKEIPNLAALALAALPKGVKVGTSSLRRACQIQALRPDLQLMDVRGNVDTRLRKLDEGEYDVLVLAAAGLDRLGLSERISLRLPPEVLLPAVAQANLIIEARAGDTFTLERLAFLDNLPSRLTTLAERAFLRHLEGGCQVPIAAYAELQADGQLWLRGLVGARDGSTIIRGARIGNQADPEGLGVGLAEELVERGAITLLAEIKNQSWRVGMAPTPKEGAANLAPTALKGWRVAVTRSEDQAEGLVEQLRALGAEPIVYPTITFTPPADLEPLTQALRRLVAGEYNWLVLTSGTAVRVVHEQLTRLGLTFTPEVIERLKVAAVGSATALASIQHLGIKPTVMPEKFVAESLAEALGDLKGQKVLLANADLSRPVLQELLTKAGAILERVIAYHTIPATGGADLPTLLTQGKVDAITFTSSSTVRFFLERIGSAALPAAQKVVIACIGAITAETAQSMGLPPTVVATTFTTEGLLEALATYAQQNVKS